MSAGLLGLQLLLLGCLGDVVQAAQPRKIGQINIGARLSARGGMLPTLTGRTAVHPYRLGEMQRLWRARLHGGCPFILIDLASPLRLCEKL